MEQKTIRALNWIYAAIGVLFTALVICTCTIWHFSRTAMIADCLIVFMMLIGFGFLEQVLPMQRISSAVKQGNIMLAEIKSSEAVREVRDTSFHAFTLMRLNLELIINHGERKQTVLESRFTANTTDIPHGYVYVAYRSGKCDEIGLVPTQILMQHANLEPIIRNYEQTVKDLCYLNVAYNHGYQIQTMRETMEKARQNHEN